MTHVKRLRLIAERDYHAARAVELTARIEADHTSQTAKQIDLSQFDPVWKSGIRLSKLGVAAILEAFDRKMRQIDIATLFHISDSAANHWHQRWEKRRQTS